MLQFHSNSPLLYYYYALSLSLAAFESCEGKVLALRYNNEFVPEITSGQQAGVLLDRTCFYAEAGGQIYDVGFMSKVGDEVCVCVFNSTFIITSVYIDAIYSCSFLPVLQEYPIQWAVLDTEAQWLGELELY